MSYSWEFCKWSIYLYHQWLEFLILEIQCHTLKRQEQPDLFVKQMKYIIEETKAQEQGESKDDEEDKDDDNEDDDKE